MILSFNMIGGSTYHNLVLRGHIQPESECQLFSLVYAKGKRSLDLVILVTMSAPIGSLV